jgi:hypothetical protein
MTSRSSRRTGTRGRRRGLPRDEKYPVPFEGLWDMREESKAATTR